MTLTTGSRLGPYEVLGAIGAGGMGEVYKARDTRLDRTVAIKVLPSHLSANPELRARFEREAKAISSLSHPNICTLHDVGIQDGLDYLVMEFLEGESLAQRLTRGPIPIEQVIRIGSEVASALDAAHRSGIVHRDLKPGNIVLTKSGAKLLDFGLAKTAVSAPTAGSALDALTSMPTQVEGAAPLTTEGTLLGTFQYMAPEQLEGKEADARTDIFALGAVLYEMVTSKPAFSGGSRASLISSIMSAQPQSVTAVQPLTPPAFERLIRTCLAKDPNDRWQTAHDVALQLQWIGEGGSAVGLPAPVSARRARREHFAWALAAIGIVGMAVFAWLGFGRSTPEPRPIRFTIPVPHGISTIDLPRISPDGAIIAFNATDSSGRTMIWLRPLNSLDANPLPGTDGAKRPFWSPDSRYVAFMSGGKLKKIPAAGGPAEVICDAPTGDYGTWGRNGDILFDGGGSDPLRRVSAAGGQATLAMPSDTSSQSGWPAFLPDGKHYFFSKLTSGKAEIMLGELGSTKAKSLGVGVSRIEYSNDGYLLFVRDRTLVAQRFNPGAGKLEGEAFPVAESLPISGNGQADFSVSQNGTLVLRAAGSGNSRMVWVDRTGRELGQVGPIADYGAPALSPDGKLIAIRRKDPTTSDRDIWIMDPARGTSTRFTFDPAVDSNPIWSKDGSRIVWYSTRGGEEALWQKSSSGLGAEQRLVAAPSGWAGDWTHDGKSLLFDRDQPKTFSDIFTVPLAGDGKAVPVIQTPFVEGRVRLSPDGQWLAYESNESGRAEVYVVSFGGPAGKWQVSTNGGSQPAWSPSGRELYYVSSDQVLMSVDIPAGAMFNAGVPKTLFRVNVDNNLRNAYCVAPDGRFLFMVPDQALLTPITAMVNWRSGVGHK